MLADAIIIYLNGASSSGKTSITKELQRLFKKPFLNAGIDSFLCMAPKRFVSTKMIGQTSDAMFTWEHREKDGPMLTLKLNPSGKKLIFGMYHAIAALVKAGNNVIVDEVALNKRLLQKLAPIFAPFKVYFIGIKCPLHILEEREIARKNRPVNSAKGQHNVVHTHGAYDFEVDTSLMSPLECAKAIKKYIETHDNPTCFHMLGKQ